MPPLARSHEWTADEAHGGESIDPRQLDDELWRERTARTCPGCGCKSIGADGMCTTCGARKARALRSADQPRLERQGGSP